MKTLLPVSVIISAVALAGCLGSGGDRPFPVINNSATSSGGGAGGIVFEVPTGPAGKVSATDAQSLATGDLANVNNLANPKDGGASSVTTGLASVPGFGTLSVEGGSGTRPFKVRQTLSPMDEGIDDCLTMSGNDADNDSDDIVKSVTYTFDCSINSGGNDGKFTFSGSMSYEDENDNKPFPEAGYQFVYDNMSYNSTYNGHTTSYIFNGSFKVYTEGRTSKMSSAYESFMQTDEPSHAKYNGKHAYFMDWSMTPVDAANPYVDGQIKFSGFYQNTQNYDIVLQYTGSVTYAAACNGFYENGTITYVDGSNNKIVYTYTNCNVAATYNGTALSL